MKTIDTLRFYYKIRRLKKICFDPVYFAGSEMYRLLNYDILQNLVKVIKPGNVLLSSDLLFNKTVITTEEQFLYILNKYIIFIRNNCFINANEFVAIIEETLKSKYSKILYNHLEFTKGDNYKVYYIEFKRMFLDGLFTNLKKFYIDTDENSIFYQIKDLSLEKDEDVEKIFDIFKAVISYRQNNLFNFFAEVPDDSNDYTKRFYKIQWRNFINDYISVKEYLDKIRL